MATQEELMQFQAMRHKELMSAAEARLGPALAWTVRCAAEITWISTGMVPPKEYLGENGSALATHLDIMKTQLLSVLNTMLERVLPSVKGHALTIKEKEDIEQEITLVIEAICESEYRVLLGTHRPR